MLRIRCSCFAVATSLRFEVGTISHQLSNVTFLVEFKSAPFEYSNNIIIQETKNGLMSLTFKVPP